MATDLREGGLKEDGQRFVNDSLGLDDDQLALIGKLAWLKTDELVEFMRYNPETSQVYVRLKRFVDVTELEGLLGRYEIPQEHSKHTRTEAMVSPFGERGIEILFGRVTYS